MQNKGDAHKGHRQRLKNRALKNGVDAMEIHEVLELMLTYTIPYKDVNPLAHALIDHFGSFANVLDAGYDQLSKFNGIGHESALFLSLLPEVFNRYSQAKTTGRIILKNINACINYFRDTQSIKHQEEFYVFCLDANYKLLQLVKIADGNSASVSFETASLTNKLACYGAKTSVLLHIHPHGAPTPSLLDLIATKKILTVCYMLGIKVEDHVIINDTDYYSFVNSGLFSKLVGEVADSLKTVLNWDAREYLKKNIGFVSKAIDFNLLKSQNDNLDYNNNENK